MPTEKAATPPELARQEAEAARQLEVWLRAFIDFPTEGNQQGVIYRMSEYQHAWMNGRIRVHGTGDDSDNN